MQKSNHKQGPASICRFDTEYQEYRETDGLIRQEINVLTNKIIEIGDEEQFGILLYSKSMRVTNYLLSLSPSVRKKCIIYICAGDVRGNTKYKYGDGLDISAELFDENVSDFNGFNAVKLIPDIYVEKIIKEGKIHAVLFGAVALYYGAAGYTHFSNTVGSKLIKNLAATSGKNIFCVVIAGQSKALNLYPDPKKWNKKKEVEKFDYPDINLINNIKSEFEEFELVDLENGDYIISGQEEPWIGKRPIPEEVFDLFCSELLKDKRELYLDNRELYLNNKVNPENATTITKTYLPEDKTIESDVISKLKNAGIVVPEIIAKGKESITLKYYKGIRIFNFLVSLDFLRNNVYGTDSAKTNLLNEIAQKLLYRCEERQKKIQKELYEQFKDSDNISPYPQNKLTNMIDLFFMCFNLKANKKFVLEEIDLIYKKFEMNAIVPFRDASTKNMILECKDLYLGLLKNDIKQKEMIKKLFDNGKLRSIVEQTEIIDIDFSSCVYYTTPYDDVISFRFHERTAHYHKLPKPDNSNDLIWNNDIPIKVGTEKWSMVATFIMRLLRFGGRKFLYRVIDPNHHSVRFKYDSELYYFRKILEIIENYGFTESLPETIKLFKEIENISQDRNFPVIPHDDKIVAKKIEEIKKRDTYSDVFPFWNGSV